MKSYVLALLSGAVIGTSLTATGHTDHFQNSHSHGSHDPHGSHGAHGSHDPHGSHGSHGAHGSHDHHGSHGSHGAHGSYPSTPTHAHGSYAPAYSSTKPTHAHGSYAPAYSSPKPTHAHGSYAPAYSSPKPTHAHGSYAPAYGSAHPTKPNVGSYAPAYGSAHPTKPNVGSYAPAYGPPHPTKPVGSYAPAYGSSSSPSTLGSYAPAYSSSAAGPSFGHGHGHGHGHAHTSVPSPYSPATPAKTWKTEFKPAKLEHDEYGICSFKDASGTVYTILFYQPVWDATQVKGSIEGPIVAQSQGAQFDFTFHEYGAKAHTNCAKIGDEWLPTQGKLESQSVTDNNHGAYTWKQDVLEQNLGGGHEQLFGRTVLVTAKGYNNGKPARAILGCCSIAEAAHPDNENHHYQPTATTDKSTSWDSFYAVKPAVSQVGYGGAGYSAAPSYTGSPYGQSSYAGNPW